MLHEIVVLSNRVDRQQAHHPDPTDAEEVSRRDVVDVFQEEETQIVDLELKIVKGVPLSGRGSFLGMA